MMPGFNEPRNKPPKNIDHYDESYSLAVLVRASFPVRGSLSVRAQFHNVPVSLPPPTSVTPVAIEPNFFFFQTSNMEQVKYLLVIDH